MTWVICEQCEDGFSYHECGDDTCACLNPEPNVTCDICNGKGGWDIEEDFGDTIQQSELDEIMQSRRAHS